MPRSQTSVTTRTVTVNAAFLQEIKEVNQELWHLLHQLQSQMPKPPQDPAACHRFEEQLGELRDNVAMHFALEEAYGYFDDPAYVAPWLGELSHAIRAEHGPLYLRLVKLCEQVEELNVRNHLAGRWSAIEQQFTRLGADLEDHEAREQDLILQAYDDDVGVGD